MSLYALAEGYKDFFDKLDAGAFMDENGVEDSEAINQAFEDIAGALDEKLENCALYVKNTGALIDAIKAEEHAFAERRHRLQKNIEKFKLYVAANMETAQYKKLETAKVLVSLRHSQSVIVDNIETLMEVTGGWETPCFTERREIVADKTAIKNAFKAGVYVPGAHMENRASVVIK